jgi:hypothetical protein
VLAAAAVAVCGVVFGLGLARSADGDPPLRALHWIAADADPRRAVATQPTECLARPAEPEAALSVEVGRAAFRTPVLLGGQAARAGLACETCHRAGRSNPDFQFPGISGAPGTADVTDFLFSSHRGDGVHDPRPIPDLSGPKSGLRIDQAPQGRALEGFIHGLIVEEFDGPEPPPAVLRGLADYVRALDPRACPPGSATAASAAADREPVDARLLMADARRAVAAARAMAAGGDRPAAVLMLAGARARLGLIDERLAGPGFGRLRQRLREASARLAAVQASLRQGPAAPDRTLARWLADSRPLEAALVGAEPRSLFDPQRLALAAQRRLPR